MVRILWIVLVLCTVGILGCAQKNDLIFGVPEWQWNGLTTEQQQQALHNFYEQQMQMDPAANAPCRR